jgi:MarR family transcriptional regulator for hemolysin
MQRDLTARLVSLSRAYRRFLDRRLADLPLAHHSALAAMLLGRLGDGVRQGTLAELLGVEGPTVVPMLDRMERAGLVQRTVDPSDKRARALVLTPVGREVAATAEIRSDEVRDTLFDGVSEEDLAAAVRVLDRLHAAIGENA